ncbi:hypothetical protein [Streptomyces sp. 6N106]|uniref:hypothetical protein n=1 Tax=Streptomyces sp. 6N106 TaxID=3457418 RepID=UPI003FD1FA65
MVIYLGGTFCDCPGLSALQHDQGPRAECYRTGTARTNIDLKRTETTGSRPRFAARARATGYVTPRRSAAPAQPRRGALNLFQATPQCLGDADIALTDVAAIAILQQRTLEQSHVENSQPEILVE